MCEQDFETLNLQIFTQRIYAGQQFQQLLQS